MAMLTLVDGVLADFIPVSDRGLLYGDGVFETIRLQRQQLLLLPAHLTRLSQSCERLGIPVRMTDIERYLELLIQHLSSANNALQEGVVKIIVTRGDGGRGYAPPHSAVSRSLLQFHPVPAGHADYFRHGIDCMWCSHPVSGNPALAGLKHLNRLDQVMASRELLAAQRKAEGSDLPLQEGLMCDTQGNVVEGTRSNIFTVIAGQLCTPDVSDAGVSGVMRSALLDWYAGQGIEVMVRKISARELRLATELFICNSVIGIWPVKRLHDFTAGTVRDLVDQTMARRAQSGFPWH